MPGVSKQTAWKRTTAERCDSGSRAAAFPSAKMAAPSPHRHRAGRKEGSRSQRPASSPTR
ncbi:hypothetical protein EYF80_033673 [Liparis tanakae]|uniref:Uncharacterized protein n=1 Tax=Liparis tanakae TaxID=230148 RepID=A0A4Z2GTK5_9TELE|nr:hypothetical protein EYF80_033673 [Liparis tanakae]